MDPLVQDVRYGIRLLRSAPAFTVVSLLALSIGIGATTAIFSVVDAVLLKPLPFPQAERLLVVYEKNASMNRFRLMVAPGNFWEWQRQSHTLQALAALQPGLRATLSGGPAGPIAPEEELRVERVSAGLFPLLGVQPIVGRAFREDEDKPGRTAFALLSYWLWQRRFAGDAGIAGKAIRLRDRLYTVVGVLPAGFSVLDPEVDLWVPLGSNPSDTRSAGNRGLTVIARLKAAASIGQARSELDAIGARMEAANAWDAGFRPSVFPFRDELVALHDEHMGATRRALMVLLEAVGLLLLMACANVANLLLARGSSRRKEIAVRTALGATRGRVMGQLCAESLLLSLAGGALGMVVAFGLVAAVRRLGTVTLPRLAEVRIDGSLLLFALGLSLLTGLLFGAAPAWLMTGGNLHASLVEGSRGGSAGRSGRWLRSLLVVAEVGLAVVLLIGAGLLIQSFTRLRSTSPGFQPDGLLTFRLPLAGRLAVSRERSVAFLQEAAGRVAALPGVSSAAAINVLPLTGFGSGSNFAVEGQPAAADRRPMGLVRSVTPGYFRTIGIPLVAGRDFAPSDGYDAAPVAIVNQAMVRRFWRDQSPLGRKLMLEHINNGFNASVVGVVGDVSPERLGSEDWPTAYIPYAQWPAAAMVMVARTRTVAGPMSLASASAREIRRMAPEQAISDVRPMDAVLDRAVADSRFNAILLGLFAAIAFVLASVGIYGVISYGVTERTRELGIRMALGARRADVLKLVLGEGARLAACGIAGGLAAAWALTRLMAGMLYGVEATDFYTFAAIAFLLGVVALAASYIPSRRAMALDPVNALRHE